TSGSPSEGSARCGPRLRFLRGREACHAALALAGGDCRVDVQQHGLSAECLFQRSQRPGEGTYQSVRRFAANPLRSGANHVPGSAVPYVAGTRTWRYPIVLKQMTESTTQDLEPSGVIGLTAPAG